MELETFGSSEKKTQNYEKDHDYLTQIIGPFGLFHAVIYTVLGKINNESTKNEFLELFLKKVLKWTFYRPKFYFDHDKFAMESKIEQKMDLSWPQFEPK